MQPLVPIDHVANELHGRLANLHALILSWLPEFLAEHRSDICAAFLRVPGNAKMIFASESEVAESFAAFRAAEPEWFVPQISRHQAVSLGMKPDHADPRECRLGLAKFNRARRLKGMEFLKLGPRNDHLAMGRENAFHDPSVEREQYRLNEASEARHAATGVNASRLEQMAPGSNKSGISASRSRAHLTPHDLLDIEPDSPFREDRPPGDPADASAPAARPSRMLPPTAKA